MVLNEKLSLTEKWSHSCIELVYLHLKSLIIAQLTIWWSHYITSSVIYGEMNWIKLRLTIIVYKNLHDFCPFSRLGNEPYNDLVLDAFRSHDSINI